MDLRKTLLLKNPLRDSLLLNNSTASNYESAAEDSDSSLYYSFTNNTTKDFDISAVENKQDPENSFTSEVDDKENTVIMKHIEVQSSVEEDDETGDDKTPEIQKEGEKMEIDDSVIIIEEQATGHLDQKVSDNKQIPEISNSLIGMYEKNHIIPTIIVEDPNENLVNPFTMSEINQCNPSTSMETSEGRESIETDKVTKRKVQESAKKSASRIPMRTHHYSPIQRNSLDKKSKVVSKPVIARRTIYETRSAIQKPKPPTMPPAKSKITVPKPVIHKCTTAGCLREFHTVKSLQEHQKTHISSSTTSASHSHASSSFKCKWCDKIFELNNALMTHMVEKCTKISFSEKRKLLGQQDKANPANDNKRRTVFMAPPVPQTRSSKRQTLNKSGIMITPKKTLKCECGKKFTDVLEFANHTIAHRYEKALKTNPA